MTKEQIDNIALAKKHLNVLDAFVQDMHDMHSGAVAALNELGKRVRDAQYKTALSEWKFERPDDVEDKEVVINDMWDELTVLEKAKRKVLEDDLAREEFVTFPFLFVALRLM